MAELDDATLDELTGRIFKRLLENPDQLAGAFRNIDVMLDIEATASSARHIIENNYLSGAVRSPHRFDLYKHLLATTPPPTGLCLEFGVASGKSISWLASNLPDRSFFGFDSFEGLPEDWQIHKKGAYSQKGILPDVPANVSLHPGWFDASLPAFVAENRERLRTEGIGLIHFDADLYSSTMTIFEHLTPFLKAGTYFLFDEFYNYPTWEHHEAKALAEWLEVNKNWKVRCAGFVPTAHQAAFILEAA
jgi:hypothetical protein